MKKIFSTTILFALIHFAKSQEVLREPVSGLPYRVKIYDNIQGSAFLFDDWKPSIITDKSGTVYLNVLVKFDAFANQFFYLKGDTTYEFITNVDVVELFPLRGDTSTKMVFKKGFNTGEKIQKEKFVQVLTEGKITSIKYIHKTQQDITQYNTPGTIKVFNDNMIYVFIKDGNIISQRPSPKLLQEILKDKWSIVDAYMKQNALNPKSEDDCVKAINYYNSL